MEKEKAAVLEVEGWFNRRTHRILFEEQLELSVWLSGKAFKKDLEIMEKKTKFRERESA